MLSSLNISLIEKNKITDKLLNAADVNVIHSFAEYGGQFWECFFSVFVFRSFEHTQTVRQCTYECSKLIYLDIAERMNKVYCLNRMTDIGIGKCDTISRYSWSDVMFVLKLLFQRQKMTCSPPKGSCCQKL